MFEFVQKHKTVIQFIMALMFVPFVFSGVNTAMNDGSARDVVAKVGSQEITQRMFENDYQRYQQQLREQLGEKYDASALDNFEARQVFLNQMIDEAVLKEAAQSEYLSTSDAAVARALMENGQVPKDAQGKIDLKQYEELLKRIGQSAATFEDGVRATLSAESIKQAAQFNANVLPVQSDYLQKLLSKVQLIEQKQMDAAPFLAAVTVTPEQVKDYYQKNTTKFDRPAMFDVEYAVLPVLPANYNPSDDEIKSAFGATNATAEELASVRKDPVKLKEAVQKIAASKMEVVAKTVIEASAASPKDLAAVAAKFGGKVESAQGVTRKGGAMLPAVLKNTDVREALTSSEMAASNALGEPVAYDGSLVLGRVVKSTAGGVQPLESVAAEIEKSLKQEQVLAQMRAQAEKDVAAMNPSAPIGATMPAGRLLKRTISADALAQVMAVKDYPKFVVSAGEEGVSIVRVVGAGGSVPSGQERLMQEVAGWHGLSGELQRRAFLQTLRERYSVKMFIENLGGRDNPASGKAKA